MKKKFKTAFVIFNTLTKGNKFWGDFEMSFYSGLFDQAKALNDLLVVLLRPGEERKNIETINSFLKYCKKKKYDFIVFPSAWSPWLIKRSQDFLKKPIYFLDSLDRNTGSIGNRNKLTNLVKNLIKKEKIDFRKYFKPNFNYDKIFGAPRLRQEVASIGASRCLYTKGIKDNYFYKTLNKNFVNKWRGCAYCFSAMNDKEIPTREKVETIKRQLVYLQKNLPYLKRVLFAFPEDLFDPIEILLQDNLKLKPLTFHIQLRPDVIVKKKKQIERILNLMRKTKLSFYLSVVGFENFSERELLILNRGYKPEMNVKALKVLDYFFKKYPKEFVMKDAVASFILFEPFTRIDDLKININSILKLKDKFSIFRNININKLRIDRGMALYELAKKEGLVSKPGFEDETEELTDLPRGGFRAGSVNYYFNETNVGLVYKIYHKILDKSSKIKKGINDKFLKIELLKKIVEII